jgi:LPS-assembly lipoprotein
MIKPAKLVVATLMGLSLLGVSACGFQPLYADRGLVTSLSQVDIVVPDTRTGYFLKQDLSKGLLEDSKAAKRYKLDVTLTERRFAVGLGLDDTASRYEISNVVAYSLTDLSTRQVVYKSSFVDATTYDAAESPYASMASQQDGQERAAVGISQKIQADLALYFHNKK